jgi:tRNA-dihydrouridine synthase B
MNDHERFGQMLAGGEPILALAPMQDITDLAFWRLLARYGGADLYVTEYFRVHAVSRLNRRILKSITENPTGRPVIAQVIGNDIPSLVRTARELQHYPIVALDLNLGCPAPVVYKKRAGGGLLREPGQIDAILGALREAVRIKFTVKTRLGFAAPEEFERLLPVFARHALDLLTVHGRVVRQANSGPVDYERIGQAVRALPCPVLANGNISSTATAEAVLKQTGARGLMIGRGAVRNPWLFEQIRAQGRGAPVALPTGRAVLDYIRALYEATGLAGAREQTHVPRMKKYLNYIGEGIDPDGQFLHQVRRVATPAELFRVCGQFLDHDQPLALEPFAERHTTATASALS